MVTFINTHINRDDVANIKSTHISSHLQTNSASELRKIYDFYASKQPLLIFTGFGGTGKRLIIDHSMGFLAPNVLRLEFDCKPASVCDDLLLSFIETMQKTPEIKKFTTPKIENFAKTLNRYFSLNSIPIIIFINAFDNIQESNVKLILDFLFAALEHKNIKIIITGKTFDSNKIPQQFDFVKIISKPLSKPLFIEYLKSKKIETTDGEYSTLYKLTRGYYYYAKLLSSSLISSTTSVKEFLTKCQNSGKIFDKYLCDVALSALSIPIRNFFWFLLLLRHGISYDALSVFDLYDEMSIKYLLQNGYIYEANGTIYVSDYFHSDVEIIIPLKIKQKLHRYIVDMYKSQLQEALDKRVLKLSRQSLNAEIEFHTKCANNDNEQVNQNCTESIPNTALNLPQETKPSITVETIETEEELFKQAENYLATFKFTDCIATYNKILNKISNIRKKVDIFIALAKVYAKISEWSKSIHYYTLAKEFFENNNEPINVNYIKYELADVHFNTFNTAEARKILKEVIYSQDTIKGLMIDACLRLGNLEDSSANYEEAYHYYKKGIESLDETANELTAQELYFKFAVTLDEANQKDNAIKYYEKYLSDPQAEEFRGAVLCNLGTLFEEDGDKKKAEKYFADAFEFDMRKNNYDGVYYAAMHLANLYFSMAPQKALHYIKMAQNSAETLNDTFYIAQSFLLAGDYYYRNNDNENALKQYLKVYSSVKDDFSKENMKKITDRIRDMELRLGSEKFTEIMKTYG